VGGHWKNRRKLDLYPAKEAGVDIGRKSLRKPPATDWFREGHCAGSEYPRPALALGVLSLAWV